MSLILEEGQRLTGMDRWLEGWTSPNEVGGQDFEQRVAFLGKGKGKSRLDRARQRSFCKLHEANSVHLSR